MRTSQIACISLVMTCMTVLPIQAQTSISLVNSGFEAGLSGWTVFTTANGTLGPAPLPTTVTPWINGEPVSKTAFFVAGQQSATPGVEEGGGVYQWFRAPAGTVTVTAYVAGLFYSLRDSTLLDSARFWLVVDGQIVSRLDLGPIPTRPYMCTGPYGPQVCGWLPGTASAIISGSARVGAGPHAVMIAITRVYPAVGPDPAESPFFYQFLDNVTVTWTAGDSR